MNTSDTQSAGELGEVYTRPWIANWILDLCGYESSRDLTSLHLVEPSCGTGAFLIPAVTRLLESARLHSVPIETLKHSISAMDLNPDSVRVAREKTIDVLCSFDVNPEVASQLSERWIKVADFILDHVDPADFVVGNPPYVRLEDVDTELSQRYRSRCERTMGGRSDLFIGFYQIGLELLTPNGVLVYICADRWMRNAYGAGLRKMVVEDDYGVEATIRLHDVDCFEDDVSAYPSITSIRQGEQGDGVLVEADETFAEESVELIGAFLRGSATQQYGSGFRAARINGWFDAGMWPEGAPEELSLVASLENEFGKIEDVLRLTRVGIGVATGADKTYITEDATIAEPDRMLPMVMAQHIADGHLNWTPTYLIDPWGPNGLVDLDEYPRLAAHYGKHVDQLGGRHVAKKNPQKWFRTIDRVNHWLTDTPKILLADMKARITPVVEPGGLYPHHNVYWITSEQWPIEALAGLLQSNFGNLFVKTYCVKMRGGTLRFQAQYIRRIRLPDVSNVGERDLDRLAQAYLDRDLDESTAIAEELYGHRYPKLRI